MVLQARVVLAADGMVSRDIVEEVGLLERETDSGGTNHRTTRSAEPFRERSGRPSPPVWMGCLLDHGEMLGRLGQLFDADLLRSRASAIEFENIPVIDLTGPRPGGLHPDLR